MDLARKSQALDKQKQLELQALQNREEFNRILESQKELREQELVRERERQDRVASSDQIKANSVLVQRDIALKEEQRSQALRQKYEEGKVIKDKEAKIKKTIEEARKSKIEYLESIGIPSKYATALGLKKF